MGCVGTPAGSYVGQVQERNHEVTSSSAPNDAAAASQVAYTTAHPARPKPNGHGSGIEESESGVGAARMSESGCRWTKQEDTPPLAPDPPAFQLDAYKDSALATHAVSQTAAVVQREHKQERRWEACWRPILLRRLQH
jgi:hypothetical protein